MDEEKLKWEKTNKLGYGDMVKNLNKLTNVIVKKELNDVMGKLNTLKSMGVIGEDNEALAKLKEKFSNIMKAE